MPSYTFLVCLIASHKQKARELEKVKRNFEKALTESVNAKNTTDEGGVNVKYSLSVNAKNDLHNALYDKNYQNEVLLRDDTPSIMTSQRGVQNHKMVMNASHIRENIFTEEEARNLGLKVDNHTHYHGIGEDYFLKIIDSLDNVKEAYRGTKNATDTSRRENYFLLVTEFTDENGNIINVPVYIDETAQYNRVFIQTNKIATVFGRDDFRRYIQEQVKNKNLVKIKNKSITFSEADALIAPAYESSTLTNSISNSSDDVKKKQLENTENLTEDAKMSLSAPVSTEQRRRARDIYGDDVSLDTSENIAPVREDVKKADNTENVKATVAEKKKIAPTKEDLKASDKEKKFTTLDIVDDDAEVKAEVKSEEAKVKSEEASSVSVSLSDTSLDNIAKTVRKALSLTPAEKKTVKEIVSRYAESGVRDTERLYEELRDNFAERSFKERVEEIADVKHALKSFKIFVPQNIKNGITDYSDFRRRNFGKLTISNEGSSVDNVYEALSYSFPNFFPSDVENDIDRLLQMSEVAGMETYKDGVDFLSDESITETAELIDDVVNTYKEKSFAEEAERERKESERKAERERKKLLIRKNMSNEERTELLRQKTIENVAVVNNAFPTPNIENFKWEDIDKVAGKEKRNIINKLAKEFGAFKEYTNKDIELTFNFSNNNFRESYSKQSKNYQTFAKMFSVFDKVIESAVGIEAHNRNKEGYKPDETLKNVYVLLSAFEDGENIVPVKLEIKEFNDKDNTLYVAVALETIKKTEVWKQGNAENGEAQNSRSVNISIPDSAKNVNRHPNLLTISLNSSLPLNSSDKG